MKLQRLVSCGGSRAFLVAFLRVFLPSVSLTVAALLLYFAVDTRHEEKLIRTEQVKQVELSKQSVLRDVARVINALRYLVVSDSLSFSATA